MRHASHAPLEFDDVHLAATQMAREAVVGVEVVAAPSDVVLVYSPEHRRHQRLYLELPDQLIRQRALEQLADLDCQLCLLELPIMRLIPRRHQVCRANAVPAQHALHQDAYSLDVP